MLIWQQNNKSSMHSLQTWMKIEDGWNIQTPAEGWTIKDQIRHLAYYEERARLAASDPEFFKQWLAEIQQDPDRFRKHHSTKKRSNPWI